LCLTLEALDTLLAIPRLNLGEVASKSREMASGICECLRQLLRGCRVGDSVQANKTLWRGVNVWLGIVGYIASCQEGRLNLGRYSFTFFLLALWSSLQLLYSLTR